MAIREIVTLGHPTLRQKARKVTKFGPELQKLIEDMVETMRAAPGVGLAAPQINIPERIIVLELPGDEEEGIEPELYAFVNPEIVKASRDTEKGEEGCLSIPGYIGEVERSVELVVRGVDALGRPKRLRAQDYLARILQHEIDHLDGVLFIDKADPATIRKLTAEEAADAEGEKAEAAALME
jgi:peptide deformylase